MDYFNKIIKESIVIVLVSSLIGLLSGTLLSINEEILYTIPIILIILPALNSLIGDISIVLISRLSSHFYIGTIRPKFKRSNRLKEDFVGLLITLLISLAALIFLGYAIGYATGISIINPALIILIILITILMLFIILFTILFGIAIFLFNRGRDPNNFLIPFVTSVADFLTPLLLMTFIIIFI